MSWLYWLLTKVPGAYSRKKAISSIMELGKLGVTVMTLDLATPECTEINWERGKTKIQELKSYNSEGIGGKLLDAALGTAFSGKAQAIEAKADKGGNWMVSAKQRRPSGE